MHFQMTKDKKPQHAQLNKIVANFPYSGLARPVHIPDNVTDEQALAVTIENLKVLSQVVKEYSDKAEAQQRELFDLRSDLEATGRVLRAALKYDIAVKK